MRYKMTPRGFAAVDDARRIGCFAYATSDYWRRAQREPEIVARLMLDSAWHTHGVPIRIEEELYLRACQCFELANDSSLEPGRRTIRVAIKMPVPTFIEVEATLPAESSEASVTVK